MITFVSPKKQAFFMKFYKLDLDYKEIKILKESLEIYLDGWSKKRSELAAAKLKERVDFLERMAADIEKARAEISGPKTLIAFVDILGKKMID